MKHEILIIDDEEEVRKVIRLQLSGTRYEVLEAADGEQGIAMLQSNPLEVEVVICDVRMPKINGVEAVAYIRREFPKTPVIVLTGYPDVDLAVEFMKEGVVEYLVKPVAKERLLETVEKALSQRTLFAGAGGM